ncbi:hypothetical protein AAFX91_14955, partial [Bradyrhizobium sp. 31Argb]|uniref:hypothetical protein n=1 Tax=Bradyrhizobium sp. 31Argb TaxID=3141247 RepID=UPI003747C09D
MIETTLAAECDTGITGAPPTGRAANEKNIGCRQAYMPRVCWDSSGVYHGSGQMDHGCEALIC